MKLNTANGEPLTAYYDDTTLKIVYHSGARLNFKNVPQKIVAELYESDDAFKYMEEILKRRYYHEYRRR